MTKIQVKVKEQYGLQLPDLQALEINTSDLEAAVNGLLPSAEFFEGLINDSGLPEQLNGIETGIAEIPEQLEQIAESAVSDFEEARDGLLDTLDGLVEEVQQLPEAFGDAIQNQLEDSANNLLDTFENAVAAEWHDLPTNAATQMQQALTQGLTDFLNVGEQALSLLREQLEQTLNESKQHLVEHVETAIESSANELQQAALDAALAELVNSQTVLMVGSQTTAALSPLLPQIKAVHVLAAEIKELLDTLGV